MVNLGQMGQATFKRYVVALRYPDFRTHGSRLVGPGLAAPLLALLGAPALATLQRVYVNGLPSEAEGIAAV